MYEPLLCATFRCFARLQKLRWHKTCKVHTNDMFCDTCAAICVSMVSFEFMSMTQVFPAYLEWECGALALKSIARLAQSAERKALNLVVVGSSPTVGDFCFGMIKRLCPARSRGMTT